ncbi:restriction endonuclease [Candidatus Parcubacteria bacterium]|nr:restriction endonuclease [Candidatus Parcubacteria bacterium]
MSTQEIFITKANGEKEPFELEKLEQSLKRAHASPANIQQVTSTIIKELEDGMTTHDIYQHAFTLLNKIEHKAALHYSLRRAVFDLGPSGFPFEKLIAEILKNQGYETLTDQMVKGHCVEHEVDVIASKPDTLIMCEAKYHSQVGMKSDLKVMLYVKARFDDLHKATFKYDNAPNQLTEGWLVTNTKFTTSAVKYAECQGMKVVGWNYPVDGNLHDLIEKTKAFPLTCLHSLSDHDKKALLEKNVILCSTLAQDESLLTSLNLSEANIEAIKEEIELIDEKTS